MKRILTLCLALIASSPSPGRAGVRHFTYLYEATTSAPGSIEFENWMTFKTGEPDHERFSQLEFRHEVEFGIAEKLQLSVYVADWRYQTGLPDSTDGFGYSATALEAIYNLTNPVTDPLGISVYEEIKIGDRLVESESKLIAQKNFGPLILAYNATLEATWEGHDLEERSGELQQTLGASYELSPRASVGLEMVHEVIFEDWRGSTQNFFIGPNVSLRHGRCFLTVTALAQATQTSGEPDLQVRTIFGFAF